jgi:hypothetical protein
MGFHIKYPLVFKNKFEGMDDVKLRNHWNEISCKLIHRSNCFARTDTRTGSDF